MQPNETNHKKHLKSFLFIKAGRKNLGIADAISENLGKTAYWNKFHSLNEHRGRKFRKSAEAEGKEILKSHECSYMMLQK